ncbi:MAG: hypothetical protein KDC19_05080 [Saprospiraceae bacterium]|nr:hypothetical protein [Saprospiraceae bacterium]
MKSLVFILGLSLITSLSLCAQSDSKDHPITRETFKMKIRVEKDHSFRVLSFVSSKGVKRSAEIVRPGELSSLKLKPGMVLEGSFRFSTFASDGGLGTTRVAKGLGRGDLKNAIIFVDDLDLSELAGVGDMAVRLK